MSLWYPVILMFINLYYKQLNWKQQIWIWLLNNLNVFLFCLMAPKLFREACLFMMAQPDLSQKNRPNFWGNWLMLLLVPLRKLWVSKRWPILLTFLQATDSLQFDSLPNWSEYKVWIYRNFIISLLRFNLWVDAVYYGSISKLESIATWFLNKWLKVSHYLSFSIILMYVACISHVSSKAKLSLIACVSSSSDLRLQELNLQLWLGNAALQIQYSDYSILSSAKKQLSAFPSCMLQLRGS